jgi:hypothetical protein
MAKLNFEFANGTLTATGANTFIQLSPTDYSARTVGDGTHIEIYPIFGDKRLRTFDFKYDDVTLDSVAYGSAALFVAAFNTALGGTLSFNTKYPEYLFSQHFELDTSVDEQPVPAWIKTDHNAGYITLTAPEDNSGDIFIGEDDVSNDSYHLEAGKSITIEIADLSLIWVQSETSGDHLNALGCAKA